MNLETGIYNYLQTIFKIGNVWWYLFVVIGRKMDANNAGGQYNPDELSFVRTVVFKYGFI